MATYFFPVRSGNAERILRRGIELPKGDDPVIYALASKSAAEHFGRGIFGNDMMVLEIDADLATYGTGEAAPVGFIAISERVPASAIRRPTRLANIEETSRSYFGGRYEGEDSAAVSARTYRDYFGRSFCLHRGLDIGGRPYRLLGPQESDIVGEIPTVVIGGETVFGAGFSWAEAEELADAVIGENIELLRDLPRVKVFPAETEEGSFPRYVQEGLNGNTVEVWEVTQKHIERGRWGSWLEEPGWHWQRLDIAEIHGPFDSADAAHRDSVENYDKPGILHPQDRPAAAMGR